jgi:hypothetical protein
MGIHHAIVVVGAVITGVGGDWAGGDGCDEQAEYNDSEETPEAPIEFVLIHTPPYARFVHTDSDYETPRKPRLYVSFEPNTGDKRIVLYAELVVGE